MTQKVLEQALQIAFDAFFSLRMVHALVVHWAGGSVFSMVLCLVAVTVGCGGRARKMRAMWMVARRRSVNLGGGGRRRSD